MNVKERRAPVLKVEDLTVSFTRYDRGWDKYELEVIHSLDVDVCAGEILAVVGSSGSGKRPAMRAVFRYRERPDR